MLEYRKGDIFSSGCEALVNPCNCVGVMGAGLAYAFKKRYPEMNKEYIKVCNLNELRPGIMHLWENTGDPKYIINFPTKDTLAPSELEYITDGLVDLKRIVIEKGIKSIAIPALGSGLGGLNYEDVRVAIERFAEDLPDVKVVAYEPL